MRNLFSRNTRKGADGRVKIRCETDAISALIQNVPELSLCSVIIFQWCNMRNITDAYLNSFLRHWVHKHEVSKANRFRLQLKYNLEFIFYFGSAVGPNILCNMPFNLATSFVSAVGPNILCNMPFNLATSFGSAVGPNILCNMPLTWQLVLAHKEPSSSRDKSHELEIPYVVGRRSPGLHSWIHCICI
jgi:hypothetical protein